MGGLPTFFGVFVMGLNESLAAFLEKNQVAKVFSPLPGNPLKGCHRAKASWFLGYPKTQLAAGKTNLGLAAVRRFRGIAVAAGGNVGGG